MQDLKYHFPLYFLKMLKINKKKRKEKEVSAKNNIIKERGFHK